ncbi:MAG: hypothetical protein WBG38_03410 [Nodosilinea sp.]
MTNYSTSQSEPDDASLEPIYLDPIPFTEEGQDQVEEPLHVFEGNWSDYTAEVADILRPGLRYQVKYEGTYWTAIPVEPGLDFKTDDLVVVVGRKGNELMIRPLPQPSEQ